MYEENTNWETRTLVEKGEPTHDEQGLHGSEVGIDGAAEPSDDSDLEFEGAEPEGDEQDSPGEDDDDGYGHTSVALAGRGAQPNRQEAPLLARLEGIQVKLRQGSAGRRILGLEIELAFDEAKPGDEEPDEAEAGEQDEGADEAEAGEQDEESGEAEAGEQDEESGEAEAGEQDEESKEPKINGFKQASLRAVSGKRMAASALEVRKLSKQGAQFIAEFEGIRLKLYNDPVGHCTIGIGHLVHRGRCNGSEPAEFKKGISLDQAYALLQKDARRMEKAVNDLGVPLNQNQFDALVSFTYNLGPNWTKSKTGLGDALRAHRYGDVPRELNKWCKAGGKVLPGLVRRRAAEGRLFAKGGGTSPKPKPVIKVADVQPGKKNNSVLIVQKALHEAVGLNYSSGPGNFGPRTKKAYAEWQRKVGFSGSDADGKPGAKSLKMLGDKYGFTVLAGASLLSKGRMPFEELKPGDQEPDEAEAGEQDEGADEAETGEQDEEADESETPRAPSRSASAAPAATNQLKRLNGVAPAKPSPGSGPLLKEGDRGAPVKALQARLDKLGFANGVNDGVFGNATERAVKQFQRSVGLKADGIVGKDTWRKLGIDVKGKVPKPGGAGGGAGGNWGGSQDVANAAKRIAAAMGIPVTSQKRNLADTIRVGSNTASDHYTGNTTAFAVDFGVSGARGTQLARAIAKEYDIPQGNIGTSKGHIYSVNGAKYRLMLLWRVKGHFDHVHLGVRRV